jgi:puromycin-sensitive aminopeptidase
MTANANPAQNDTNPKAYRLPETVRPRLYEIALDARPGRETFHGSVTIQLEIAAPVSAIELHARDLEISNARLTSASGEARTPSVALDAAREIAVITLDSPVPAGKATLALDFSGHLSASLEGLFLSKDGPDELLCSQCEATGARAIIPCWDEPTFKARFAWSVTTAPGQTVLTNGTLLSQEPDADGTSVTWRFATTKPMASYLIAIAIGDFASTPERTVNGIPLGVWALKGKEALGAFALDVTAELLPFYENYFAKPYHFDKLDNVGVPNFGAGAMENAGLIISQAVLLLLDERASSRRQELTVAGVTAHEFAHMWFGDLVTMRWWDDLWLNEAFATWMSYHAIDTLRPHYHVWDETQGEIDAALGVDALASSHPIYNTVSTPREVLENFDLITYQKGCAVLRMTHDFLGDEAFRAGLRTYMAEFAESNATGADLWRHLQQASHLPVSDLMTSWILQAGHPLVDVSLGSESAPGVATIHLSQRRFFSAAQAPASDQLWQVPLQLRYEDDAGVHTTRYLLTERDAACAIPLSGELRWLYANAGEVGFYRQRLDATLLAKARAHLDALSAAERKGLLRDQWALVSNGSQPITAYLDTVAALSGDEDVTLVRQITGEHLSRIENLLEYAGDQRAMAGYRAWVARLFIEKMNKLGYEPRASEPVETARLRASTLGAMTIYARDAEAIAQARQLQAREAANPAALDPNIAPIAINATAHAGDSETYERYLTIYQSRKGGGFTPDQIERYADTFALFEPQELAARTIALMSQGEDVFPFQEQLGLMATMLTQPRTQRLAWGFITAGWEYVQTRAPFLTPRMVEFSGILPESMRAEVVAFWDEHLKGEYAGPYARALEQMDQNAELQSRTRPDLLAYFTK